MPYISTDRLNQIRKVDLLTYLKQNEPEDLVQLSPNTYSTRTHDSLKISNGLWHQWSTGIGGRSALDYLIKIRGMSLPEAALAIERTVARPSFSYAREPPKATDFHLPERNDDNDRVVRYLTSRGIDRGIVHELVNCGRIYEDRKYHNVVFVGIDEHGCPRHAAIRSTNSNRYMIDAAGSDKRYSFALESPAESGDLHVFESAIDLLSFCTLELANGDNWRTSHKLSLSGVSLDKSKTIPAALEHFSSEHPNVNTVFLHLDNDVPGRRATETIRTALSSHLKCVDAPPPSGKDYNEFLIQKNALRKRSDAR